MMTPCVNHASSPKFLVMVRNDNREGTKMLMDGVEKRNFAREVFLTLCILCLNEKNVAQMWTEY